jgi:hypothetical protein
MPFYKLGTLADMSRMIRSLVVAKKYMQDISAVEDELRGAGESIPKSQYNSGVIEMSRYATAAADSIREAIRILTDIRQSVSDYKRSL